MKLELKYISPYLPYDLGLHIDGCVLSSLEGIDINIKDTIISERISYKFSEIKLLLNPLDEIFNIEEINEQFSDSSKEQFVDNFLAIVKPLNRFDNVNYTIMDLCFKYHLDIFGLIEENLAFDINTYKNNIEFSSYENKKPTKSS